MGKIHFTNDIKKLAALVTFLQAICVPLFDVDLKKGSHFDEFFVEKCKHFGIQKRSVFCALYIYESTTVSPDEELKMNWALGKAAHRSKRRREGTAPTHLLLLLPADRLSKHGQAFFLATSLFKAHMPVCRHFPHPRLRRQRKILKMQTLN